MLRVPEKAKGRCQLKMSKLKKSYFNLDTVIIGV